MLNPKLVYIYQEAYCQEAELHDYSAWLNGYYVMCAIQAAMLPKKVKYPQFPITKQSREEEMSGEDKFKLWIAKYNQRFEKE